MYNKKLGFRKQFPAWKEKAAWFLSERNVMNLYIVKM